MRYKYSCVLDCLCGEGYDVLGDPEKYMRLASKYGYAGIDAPSAIEDKDVAVWVRLCRKYNLEIPMVTAAWGGWHAGENRDLASNDPKIRAHAVAYAKKCIALANKLESGEVEIVPASNPNTYPNSLLPKEKLKENFLASMGELTSYAREMHVQLLFEPINRYEGHPGFLNSLDDAIAMVKAAGADDVYGIQPDLFHMYIEDADFYGALARCGKYVKHIHLADTGRTMPGTGNIDFKKLLSVLEDISFDSFMSLDCVPIVVGVEDYLKHSIQYMRAMEDAWEMTKKIMTLYYV